MASLADPERESMVKLAEWRGKEIFRKYGVPLPRGQVVRSPAEVAGALQSAGIPLPCVIKAQVLAGGRGKGGAVRFASTVAEAEEATRAILALEFKGEKVREVLIEEKLPIARELYVSLTLDRSRRLPLAMASGQGGVEIETVDESAITRVLIDPFPGLVGYERRRLVQAFGVTGPVAKSVDDLLGRLWRIFVEEDAELVEINPLAVVGERVVAL
ncbi:MAG: ATP-grasp domain-containing protein, partial [Candidatus Lutacidiplasmatales archaeon]